MLRFLYLCRMKKIGIIVAMDKEFAQLKTLLDEVHTEHHHHKDFVIGQMGQTQVIMLQCGIGKVNSTIGAVEMIDCYGPDLLISTGVAGGANPDLKPLDVVVSEACTYHDVYCGTEVDYGQVMGLPTYYESPRDIVEKTRELEHPMEGMMIVRGLTVTGDCFVDSREKMQEILNHFPDAMAVDMESCSIAQTCHIYHVPFVSFRIISDVPLRDSKASQYFDFWERMAEGSFEVTRAFLKKII